MALSSLDRVQPVVDDKGRPTQRLQSFSEDVFNMRTLTGVGSPEGVIEAAITVQYMDTAGGVGTILYIKKLSNIGGDRTKGWILV